MIKYSRLVVALFLTLAPRAFSDGLIDATKNFLDTLTPDERAKAVLPFNSEERLNWHFVPKERLGVSFAALDERRRALVLDILRAGLSEHGFTVAETIRSLELVLREMEKAEHRDPERYFVLVFGEPSDKAAWSLRYEGHHLSFNWTYVDGKLISSSPQFLGANPAEVRINGPMKGTRALAPAEDIARLLIGMTRDQQRATAIIAAEAPNDILTSNAREVSILEDLGLAYSSMEAPQQGVLMTLIDEVARIQPPAISQARLDKIRAAGLDNIKFAWMGSVDPGQRHYYRIQGPTFLIEYDNTQNGANHVHLVWRDFENDFGRDVLKEHYAMVADPSRSGVHAH